MSAQNAGNADDAVDVQGEVADGYEPVREAFAENFRTRGETGAALTVHREGRIVVDLWGGSRNPAPDAEGDRGTGSGAWQSGTAAVVRSASKGPAAAVLHLLHQRGQLDLDAPVATYWPQFKANGKDRLLVRHVLAHRGGLPALEAPLTPEQAFDGVSGPSALAAQAPLWEPGTEHGYHPHTFGWLLGELVQRATGRPLGRWFAEEVARPLGLDIWFGLPRPGTGAAEHPSEAPASPPAPAAAPAAVDLARLADVPTPEPSAASGLRVRPKRAVTEAYGDHASLTRRAFDSIGPRPDENAPECLAAGLPGSGAIATARSLSRFYAALIGPLPDASRAPVAEGAVPAAGPGAGPGAGEGRRTVRSVQASGKRLFTPATLTQARSQESSGPDRVLVVNSRFGLGFMLHSPSAPMLAPGSFGHPGRGGSLAFADPESGTAVAYVTAAMQRSVTSDPRTHAVVRALRACL
ncbi:serine hydrolase domain-containing protein [Streptomyces ovatisporus]|uniref:Serine hydrolase domain-containing protein n=1 Tax=Streptomyces ovatisporus TaxID=1128682 RepID=A0ABV9A4Y2_9ACTN